MEVGLMEAVFGVPYPICLHFPLRLTNLVEQGSHIDPRYPLLRKMKEPPPMAPLLTAALSLLRRDRAKEAKEEKRKRKDPGVKLVRVVPKRAPRPLPGEIARRRLELQTKSTSQNSQVLLINRQK